MKGRLSKTKPLLKQFDAIQSTSKVQGANALAKTKKIYTDFELEFVIVVSKMISTKKLPMSYFYSFDSKSFFNFISGLLLARQASFGIISTTFFPFSFLSRRISFAKQKRKKFKILCKAVL